MNKVCMQFLSDVVDIFDKHVRTKQMYKKLNQLPYINRELRKSIYEKKMFYNKYLKFKTSKTLEGYRKNKTTLCK